MSSLPSPGCTEQEATGAPYVLEQKGYPYYVLPPPRRALLNDRQSTFKAVVCVPACLQWRGDMRCSVQITGQNCIVKFQYPRPTSGSDEEAWDRSAKLEVLGWRPHPTGDVYFVFKELRIAGEIKGMWAKLEFLIHGAVTADGTALAAQKVKLKTDPDFEPGIGPAVDREEAEEWNRSSFSLSLSILDRLVTNS